MRSSFSRLFFLLTLLGYWSPWVAHPAAALRMNGYDLSEWVTFLPGVRDGSLPLRRLDFFIPLACLAVLFSLNAAPLPPARWRGLLPNTPLRWLLLSLAGLCAFIVFPPYPAYVFPDYWPEYQTQFIIACITVLACGASYLAPERIRNAAQVLLALLGAGYGAWAWWTLRPTLQEFLGPTWAAPGWGWLCMLLGLAGLAYLGIAQLLKTAPRP
jgi:hypothetical protein